MDFKTFMERLLQDEVFSKEYIKVSFWVDLGREVALLRKRMGMTREQLAELLGLPRSVIEKIETGYGFELIDAIKAIIQLVTKLSVPRGEVTKDGTDEIV